MIEILAIGTFIGVVYMVWHHVTHNHHCKCK